MPEVESRMKHVSIVIVNWNGVVDTCVALDSIQKLHTNKFRLETYVVDNGSTNDSVSILQNNYPWIHLIEAGNNLGFSGGNNVGIQAALDDGADLVWLLNNDTYVSSDSACLADAFDDVQVGVAGSKIYFAKGHEYHKTRYKAADRGKVIWYAGGKIDWRNMYASHRGVDEVDHGQYEKTISTEFVTGCSMMISRAVFERIGKLDDAYYLYLEDVDFSLRAKRAGFDLIYYPKSMIWHINAGSTGGPGNPVHEYYQTRNRILAGMRYAPLRTKVALIKESLRFLFYGSTVKRKAITDAFFGRWGKQYETKTSIT